MENSGSSPVEDVGRRWPKRFISWLVVLLALVCLTWLILRTQVFRDQSAQPLTGTPHEIIEGSGLFFLGADSKYSHAASYALTTPDGTIVVDPGLRFSMLQSAFRQLGLNTGDVRIVLITHRHADHWFATRELVEKSGARVMAHRLEVAALTTAADLGDYYASYPATIKTVPTLLDVQPLEDGEIVRLGNAAIEVIATPGHTPGSACYRTELNGLSVLWSGDTVLTLSAQTSGGEYVTRIGPRFGGNIDHYLASLRRLQSVSVDVLLPGHPAFGSRLNPKIGPDGWTALVHSMTAKLERWTREHSSEARLFLDGIPKALTPEILYLGESHSTATYVLKTSEGLLCVDPGMRTVDELDRLLESFGHDVQHVSWVLITTLHPEHYAASQDLRAATGAEILSGPRPRAASNGRELDPDRILADRETIFLGDLRLKALDSGAGAMSYLADVLDRVVLIGGDNVARFPLESDEEHHSNMPLPDPAREHIFYQMLRQQSVQWVLPSHPRYDEAPFYLPGEWELRCKSF